MTAGRGIMHEEMPQVRPEGIAGFQLWVNLPAKLKMTKPRYQDIAAAEVPEIQRPQGVRIRMITGTLDGIIGPVTGIAADPTYMDLFIPPRTSYRHPVERGQTAFAYVFEGEACFQDGEGTNEPLISHPHLVVFDDGDTLAVRTEPIPFVFFWCQGNRWVSRSHGMVPL